MLIFLCFARIFVEIFGYKIVPETGSKTLFALSLQCTFHSLYRNNFEKVLLHELRIWPTKVNQNTYLFKIKYYTEAIS